MDPFEVRMQFNDILNRLSASQQSIQKAVNYALKYFPNCGEDIWDCIIDATCHKDSANINSQINLLYFLDSLCEGCLLVKSHSRNEKERLLRANGLYVEFVSRDLNRIIPSIVPEGRQGLPNLVSAKQVLENWRIKRYVEPHKIDDLLASLDARPKIAASTHDDPASRSSTQQDLSRVEINRRIEQDRERHKRLRERRWVQPASHNPIQASQLASFYPLGEAEGQEDLPLDIEFENEWETTSDWNEDDDEAIAEEAALAFPEQYHRR